MRPTLWLTLIVCCVVGCMLRCALTEASARPQIPVVVSGPGNAPATIPAGQTIIFKADLEGFGEADEDARDRVLENACDRVARYLAETHNETDYKPTKEFLQELKVIPATADIEVTNNALKDLPDMKKATVKVQVTSDSLKMMCDQACQQRVKQRQHWLGLGLASFVALLLVGAGYLRLEEETKGYYTGLLRLSALGLLGMVAGGIWYVS